MNKGIDLDIEQTNDILQGIKIPTRPKVLDDFLKEKEKPDVNLYKLAKIIGSDIALSAAIIKTVNSPFWGVSKDVSSIFHAVTLLGIKNVSNIVNSLALRNAYTLPNSRFLESFWNNAAEVGLLAAKIAASHSSISGDKMYTLGLVRDCGVLLLTQKFPDYEKFYLKACQNSQTSILEIEKKANIANHNIVSYITATRWQFPRVICQVVLKHHNISNPFLGNIESPDEETSMLAILKIAEHISNYYHKNPDYYEWTILKDDILKYMNIEENTFQSYRDSMCELLNGEYNN